MGGVDLSIALRLCQLREIELGAVLDEVADINEHVSRGIQQVTKLDNSERTM
jgi:hypothetical protein